jgi:hypothetical protein
MATNTGRLSRLVEQTLNEGKKGSMKDIWKELLHHDGAWNEITASGDMQDSEAKALGFKGVFEPLVDINKRVNVLIVKYIKEYLSKKLVKDLSSIDYNSTVMGGTFEKHMKGVYQAFYFLQEYKEDKDTDKYYQHFGDAMGLGGNKGVDLGLQRGKNKTENDKKLHYALSKVDAKEVADNIARNIVYQLGLG